MLYAVLSIIFFVVTLASAVWYWKRKREKALAISIVCFVEFFILLYIANFTGDPIPYWEF